MKEIRFCYHCKFICKPTGAIYEPHPESICLCAGIQKTNYVTGNDYSPKCKDINFNGKCKYYKEKSKEQLDDELRKARLLEREFIKNH